jgi:hypothetical protein
MFLESEKKMTQKQNLPSNPPSVKEVNHTTHWQQPSSTSSSSCYHSYQHSHTRQEHPTTYHRQPSSYYKSYHYVSTTNQIHPTPPSIAYPPPLPQITYPMSNTPSHKPKTEPNTLLPPAQQPEPSQKSNNFLTFEIIHTITGGSNLDFQNKWQKREYYR